MKPAESVEKANAFAGNVDVSVLTVKAVAALPAQASKTGGEIRWNMFIESCHKEKLDPDKEEGPCRFKDKRALPMGKERGNCVDQSVFCFRFPATTLWSGYPKNGT